MTVKGRTGWKEEHDHCEHLKGTTGISKCSAIANIRNYKIQTGLGWSTTMPLQGNSARALGDGCIGACEPRQVSVKGISFIFKNQFPPKESFSSFCWWQM